MESSKVLCPINCKKNLICLQEGIYKCYKCIIDKEKDYIPKDELPDILHPICNEIEIHIVIYLSNVLYLYYIQFFIMRNLIYISTIILFFVAQGHQSTSDVIKPLNSLRRESNIRVLMENQTYVRPHACKRDMISIAEERRYKCYKCLNRDKEYLNLEELPKALQPICLKIAEREVYGERYDRFMNYSRQQVFTEQEVEEIMDAQKIPQEEQQNPLFSEMKTIVKRQVVKIESLENEIAGLKRTINLIRDPRYLSLNTIYMIEFAKKQQAIDVLAEYDDLKVQTWMIEWALRSKQKEITDKYLKKYFDGVRIELQDNNNCHETYCQVITIYSQYIQSQGFQYQYLHIMYDDVIKFEIDRIAISDPSYSQEDSAIEKDLIMLSIIKHYYSLELRLVGPSSNGYYKQRDLQISRFQKDGKMVMYNLSQGSDKIFCENTKLVIKAEQK